MSAFIHINGLDFNIFIRGLLVVLTGVGVLMGSVYVLLATNSGARTGLLLAATGFFGWMVIMGIIWWIYGIGLQGDARELEGRRDQPRRPDGGAADAGGHARPGPGATRGAEFERDRGPHR